MACDTFCSSMANFCGVESLGRHALGVICVLFVVFLWVSSSELTQSIFKNNNYNHPFFLTYFNTSLFMVYGPFFIRLCINYIETRNDNLNRSSAYSSLSPTADHLEIKSIGNGEKNLEKTDYNSTMTDSDTSDFSSTKSKSDNDKIEKKSKNEENDSNECNNYDENIDNNGYNNRLNKCCISQLNENQLTFFETFKMSAVFCPVWFLMNYTFNASLDKTSVASNTILSTMSGPFSLILSFCFLKTRFSVWNIVGVAIVYVLYIIQQNLSLY